MYAALARCDTTYRRAMSQLSPYVVLTRLSLNDRLVDPDMNVDGVDVPMRVRLKVRFDVDPAALMLLPSDSNCYTPPPVSYSTREFASTSVVGEKRAIRATGDRVIGALREVVYCGSLRLPSGLV